LREFDQDFAALNVAVRFIGIGDRAKVDEFCGRFNPDAQCIADETKATYVAMGLGDYDLSRLQTDAALQVRRKEANASGFRLNMEATIMDDATQLPGAAVIDRDGTVRWIYRGVHPGDLPHMRVMLDATRAALRG
jgi:hypothetical protein